VIYCFQLLISNLKLRRYPKVEMRPSFRDTGFTASYRFDPLTNMMFTRDQQITTRRGLVMGRLRSAQRQHEAGAYTRSHLRSTGAYFAPPPSTYAHCFPPYYPT
jgi:arginine deiminase